MFKILTSCLLIFQMSVPAYARVFHHHPQKLIDISSENLVSGLYSRAQSRAVVLYRQDSGLMALADCATPHMSTDDALPIDSLEQCTEIPNSAFISSSENLARVDSAIVQILDDKIREEKGEAFTMPLGATSFAFLAVAFGIELDGLLVAAIAGRVAPLSKISVPLAIVGVVAAAGAGVAYGFGKSFVPSIEDNVFANAQIARQEGRLTDAAALESLKMSSFALVRSALIEAVKAPSTL